MPLRADGLETWPPAYRRAMHAVHALNAESVPSTLGAVCVRMNLTRPADTPEFDDEVVGFVLRRLKAERYVTEHDGAQTTYAPTSTAPLFDLGSIGSLRVRKMRAVPGSNGASPKPAPYANANSKPSVPGASSDKPRVSTSALAGGQPGSAASSQSPVARATKVDKSEARTSSAPPAGQAKAILASTKVPAPTGPVVKAEPKDAASSAGTDAKPAKTEQKPAEAGTSETPYALEKKPGERTRDRVERIIRASGITDWFTGDEIMLPDDMPRGRFKGSCANLVKPGILERKSQWVGASCIYVYRLRS